MTQITSNWLIILFQQPVTEIQTITHRGLVIRPYLNTQRGTEKENNKVTFGLTYRICVLLALNSVSSAPPATVAVARLVEHDRHTLAAPQRTNSLLQVFYQEKANTLYCFCCTG